MSVCVHVSVCVCMSLYPHICLCVCVSLSVSVCVCVSVNSPLFFLPTGSGAAVSSQSCETETAEEKTGPQPQQNWKACLIKENVSLPLRPCGNDTVDVPFQNVNIKYDR